MTSIEKQIKEEGQKKTIVKGLCAILENILDDMEKASGVKSELYSETAKYHNAKKVADMYLSEQEMEKYKIRYQELMERNVKRSKSRIP